MAERLEVEEDLIFHERTALHPTEKLFSRYLGNSYHLICGLVCPSALGYAAKRPRQMCLAVRKRLGWKVSRICRSPSALFRKP
eukprot:13116849-Alexandrium_andersonii.AAC.1